MAGTVGYLTQVYKTGTPTAFTSEAMSTATDVANTYQIDSTTRDIWDRDATLTFSQNGTTLSSTRIEDVNYVFGRVTFNAATTGAIAVSGEYLPRTAIGGAYSYSLTQTADVLDDTDYDAGTTSGSDGYRTRTIGLMDVELTVTRWFEGDNSLFDRFVDGDPIVAEVHPGGGSGPHARGYFVVSSENFSGDVSALEQSEITFNLDGDVNESFRWSDQ